MGRRELRRELGALIEGRIFEGHKLAAYRRLPGWKLRRLIDGARVQPGDLIHDCDGFNHRVSAVEQVVSGSMVRELVAIDISFDDGSARCGCGVTMLPRSREEIEAWWREWLPYQHDEATGWDLGPFYVEMHRRLISDEHICDEEGKVLPELSGLER